jgi:tRNA(Ile)-lysidine synthase
MLSHFKKEIENANIGESDKILLAVSGGIDSMVMTYLCHELGLNIAIAHVNYQLRGKESELDAEMVKSLAQKLQLPFFQTNFNTKEIVKTAKESTQIVARNLRYEWFDNLVKEKKFDYLFTAHHLNDSVETFFLNLNRGSGIKGLLGIRDRSYIHRPLKSFSRSVIEEYAISNGIKYREDSSNKDTNYLRNWLRHKIISPWQERNPAFLDTMKKNMDYLGEVNDLVQSMISKDLKRLEIEKLSSISFAEISKWELPKFSLHACLQPYGFSFNQIEEILQKMKENSSGQLYYSNSHQIIIDRNSLVLGEIESNYLRVNIEIFHSLEIDKELVQLELELLTEWPKLEEMDTFSQYLDWDLLNFPLNLRNWENGDKIKPLGMKGSKKASDVLTDNKVPISAKKKTLVIQSGSTIVSVVGQLINNDFRITDKTKRVLRIRWQS